MKRKLIITVILFFVIGLTGVQAQTSNGFYLGQKPPGKTPELFAPGIVSVENTKEHCLAVSPKGDEMFFTAGAGWPNSKIMHVKKAGNQWLPSAPATFLKNDWATQPAFSPDGQYLYFSSSLGDSDIQYYKICRCKKIGKGWSEPEVVIDMPGNLIMEFHPSVDRDGSVYFLRWDFPNQTGDIYVAKATGDKLEEPVKLNSPISTEFSEVRPTVDPLGKYLLFVSDRPGGYGGKDVYVCYRNPNGAWSAPQNLGPELNTPGNDDVPTVSPDGKYWFFEKNDDIYWRESPEGEAWAK
jgi:hypothetical protein